MKIIFHLLRIILYIHIEKKHRLVFDNLYKQDYIIKLKDKPLLNYYKLLCRIAPNFRSNLKTYKVINTELFFARFKLIDFLIYKKLKKINTKRYSS